MAINRYTIDGFASLELNNAAFPRTGRVLAQTPLASSFTALAPCENGMWVNASVAAGSIAPVSAAGQVVGIVYTTEKEYNQLSIGLKKFAKVGGEYPRVGIFSVGDIVTSNCFCYDTATFADDDAVDTALAAIGTTPLYLIPYASGAPKLVLAAGLTGAKTIARVIKKTTVPNGDVGLQYEIIATNSSPV